jgi:hypothetical protein
MTSWSGGDGIGSLPEFKPIAASPSIEKPPEMDYPVANNFGLFRIPRHGQAAWTERNATRKHFVHADFIQSVHSCP